MREILNVVSSSLGDSVAMIVSSTKIGVPPENRKEFLQTLQALIGRIRHERGCIKYNVYQDVENANAFIFIEEWETQADLYRHLRSDRFGVLLGALRLLSDTSEIKFSMLSQPSEIEAFKEFRG
jgi:quinol monooxygenase YgiN